MDNLTVVVFDDLDGDGELDDDEHFRFERMGRPDGVSSWFALGDIPIPPGENVVALATLSMRDGHTLVFRLDQFVK